MTLQQAVNKALDEAFDAMILRAERDAVRVWRDLVHQGVATDEAAEAVANFRHESDEAILASLPSLEVQLYRQLTA